MSWRDAAACRGSDPELFFPASEAGEPFEAQVAEAKAVCARCPVREQCLADALEGLPHGVAGGLSAEERRAQRRSRPSRPRAPAMTPGARVLAGEPARAVAAEQGVSERTAYRWAARVRLATAAEASAVAS